MKTLIVALFMIMFVSCTREEPTVNLYQDSWDMLVSVNSQPPVLSIIHQPGGSVVNADVYSQINQKPLSSPVRKMLEYGKYIYLMMPDEYKIEILNKVTYKLESTIDFSSTQSRPVDMCIRNFTDAFIIFDSSNKAVLFDLHFLKMTNRVFTVGKTPVAISCSGSQVYVANQGDNTITVIDAQLQEVVGTIPVPAVPSLIDFTSDGSKAVVVSLGEGKANPAETKTAAMVTLIDVATRSVVKSKEIGFGAAKAVDLYPKSLTVTSTGWAFIASPDFLLRYDTRLGDKLILIEKGPYVSASFNSDKNKLLLLKNNSGRLELSIAETTGGKPESTFTLPPEVLALLLL